MPIPYSNTIFTDASENFVSNPTPRLNEEVTFSIRMSDKIQPDEVYLICWPTGEVIYNLMRHSRTECGFAYYSVTLLMNHRIFDYRFVILKGRNYTYYMPQGCFDTEPADFYSFRIVADSDYSQWTPQAIFYQIFPDRFARGRQTMPDGRAFTLKQPHKTETMTPHLSEWDEPVDLESWKNETIQYYGGNFSGITSKLDYLADLGITAIYLTPVFKARTNHRYDTEDYDEPDPLLGTKEELSEMISEAHRRGIRIIFDGVFNHTGLFHKWFDHLCETGSGAFSNPDSQYKDYYIWHHHPYGYESWFDCKILPQLNLENAAVRDELINKEDSVIKKWLKPPYSIDGWRMDTAHILGKYNADSFDDMFNRELHSAVKSVNPDAYLMGETWYDATHFVGDGKYEAAMNYRGFLQPLKMWLTGSMSFLSAPRGHEQHNVNYTAAQALAQLCRMRTSLPFQNQIRMYNLLDSHDTERFWTLLNCDFGKLRIALTILFTYIGIPAFYYGDEIGMEGSHDPDCRRPMIWDKSHQNGEIAALYRSLIALRKNHQVMTFGSCLDLYADDDILCFGRMLGNDYVITVCNSSDKQRSVNIPTAQLCGDGVKFTEHYTGGTYTAQGGQVSVTLPPWGAGVLVSD